MPAPTDPEPPVAQRRGRTVATLVAGLVLVAGLSAVLYGMGRSGKEGADPACGSAAAAVTRLDPLVHGEIAALNLSRAPKRLDDVAFLSADGARTSLADFRGRTVLLNLWATWCVPCRTEMPALDRLQAQAGGADFQVVAVNIDTAKLDRPRQFLADVGATALPFYADPTAGIFQRLRQSNGVIGLPTTFLLDANGCTLGMMAGPADWSSPDARRLIEAARS